MPMSGEQFVEWLDQELEPLRREVIASPYYDAWCSGKLSQEQLFQVMGHWYAYLKHIPSIMRLDSALSRSGLNLEIHCLHARGSSYPAS